MKKLIMFIAVAIVAVAGHSAEIMWGAGNNWIKDKDGNNLAKNTDLMLIMASDASNVSSAFAAGNSISSYVLDTAATSNTKGYVADHEVSSTKFTAGQTYDLAIVIVKGDDYVISGSQTFTAYTAGVDEASSLTFGPTQSSSPISAWGPKSGGGDTPSIPEPTSALLLVMGGAMLALRRKQK